VEEDFWRELLLKRLEPLLAANNISFQIDVITDYGSDPLQGVAAAVVATAEQMNAAALVVCGHSKGTLAEWILGSVSDYAAHHAAVPVVVLHGSSGCISATSSARQT
jgi:nucleotide-binding universal stress UspA family protein